MKNKIFNLLFLAILVMSFSLPALAEVGIKKNNVSYSQATDLNLVTSSDSTITNDGSQVAIPVLDSSLLAAGTANGGATSVASTTAACPTGFAFVRKVIPSNGDTAFTLGTLANGKPGQILYFKVAGLSPSGATTGGSYKITPATSYGFTSITFTAVGDWAQFQFIDNTTGWVLLNSGGTVTIVLKA